jgi:hypothetical protein
MVLMTEHVDDDKHGDKGYREVSRAYRCDCPYGSRFEGRLPLAPRKGGERGDF